MVSVAARAESRARDYAKAHGIPNFEADYDALLARPDVDLVYNGLPPSEHKHWTIAALSAGKHVLCEKPFAMNGSEAEEMVRVAKETGNTLIEAFHYRFHPLFARVLKLLDSGAIGTLREIKCHFNVPVVFSVAELRYNKHLGGGAMMDLGCYPVHWARTLTGEEPKVVSVNAEWHESGVDTAMGAELVFPSGIVANIRCSMSEKLPDRIDAYLKVIGEKGSLAAENPLAPQMGHELILESDGHDVSETFDRSTTYLYQLRHIVDVIEDASMQVTGGADAVNNMRVLDAIYRVAGG